MSNKNEALQRSVTKETPSGADALSRSGTGKGSLSKMKSSKKARASMMHRSPLPEAALLPKAHQFKNFEPSHRFENLKERLHLVRNRANGGVMNLNAITELVEEARINKAAVVEDPAAAGKEMKHLMGLPHGMWRGLTVREIHEYARRLMCPFPGAMLERERLSAWHYCVGHLKLVEFSDGQDIVTEGETGPSCYWLLQGDAHCTLPPDEEEEQAVSNSPTHKGQMKSPSKHQAGPVDPMGLIGGEALFTNPYTGTTKAVGTVFCASLSAKDYQSALQAETEGVKGGVKQLKQLLLVARNDRTHIHVKDISAHLSVFDLFQNMDSEFRDQICKIVEYISVPAGDMVFEEGERICFCYVILQGAVSFTQINPQTKRNEEIGIKVTGQHFGTLATLSVGEKKRPFTAVASEHCEFAVISRIGYNRIMRMQLKGMIEARAKVVKSMAVMSDANDLIVQRVAFNSQSETFQPGHLVVNPACYPGRIFVIMEGECKLVWLTDDTSTPPPIIVPLSQHATTCHHGLTQGMQHTANMAAAMAAAAAAALAGAEAPTPSAEYGGGKRVATVTKEDIALAKEAKGARDAAQNLMQQMGNTSSQTVCGCGVVVPPGPLVRKRHALELALLGYGDVLNGSILVGLAPSLAVIAKTKVVAFSMEVDSVEDFFGPSAFRDLKAMLHHQWEVNRVRLDHMLSVRKDINTSFMSASQHRVMSEDPAKQSQFLEHFVPPGPSDLGLKPANVFGACGLVPAQGWKPKAPPPLVVLPEPLARQRGAIGTAVLPPPMASGERLPASFEDLCKIKASMVFGEADSAQQQQQMAIEEGYYYEEDQMQEMRQQQQQQQFQPQAPAWRPANNQAGLGLHTFAGSMHACLGDMMESAGRGRLRIAGRPSPTSWLSVTAPASLSGGTEAASHSGQSPEHTGRGGLAGRGRINSPGSAFPMLDSPALLSKMKLQPLLAPSTIRHCSDRSATIMSFAQSREPQALPQLGSFPPKRSGGGAGDRGQDQVAIMTQSMTSYTSVLFTGLPVKETRASKMHAEAVSGKWGTKPFLTRQSVDAFKDLQSPSGGAACVNLKAILDAEAASTTFNATPNITNTGSTVGQNEAYRMQSLAVASLSSGQASHGHPVKRMGTGNRGSARSGGGDKNGSFRVRSVKAWRRPDEEVDLPLDRDALAPALKDHTISHPNHSDLKYILNRWGDRWAADREQTRKRSEACVLSEANSMALRQKKDEDEELWDLDQFGAPTYGPGLL